MAVVTCFIRFGLHLDQSRCKPICWYMRLRKDLDGVNIDQVAAGTPIFEDHGMGAIGEPTPGVDTLPDQRAAVGIDRIHLCAIHPDLDVPAVDVLDILQAEASAGEGEGGRRSRIAAVVIGVIVGSGSGNGCPGTPIVP